MIEFDGSRSDQFMIDCIQRHNQCRLLNARNAPLCIKTSYQCLSLIGNLRINTDLPRHRVSRWVNTSDRTGKLMTRVTGDIEMDRQTDMNVPNCIGRHRALKLQSGWIDDGEHCRALLNDITHRYTLLTYNTRKGCTNRCIGKLFGSTCKLCLRLCNTGFGSDRIAPRLIDTLLTDRSCLKKALLPFLLALCHFQGVLRIHDSIFSARYCIR